MTLCALLFRIMFSQYPILTTMSILYSISSHLFPWASTEHNVLILYLEKGQSQAKRLSLMKLKSVINHFQYLAYTFPDCQVTIGLARYIQAMYLSTTTYFPVLPGSHWCSFVLLADINFHGSCLPSSVVSDWTAWWLCYVLLADFLCMCLTDWLMYDPNGAWLGGESSFFNLWIPSLCLAALSLPDVLQFLPSVFRVNEQMDNWLKIQKSREFLGFPFLFFLYIFHTFFIVIIKVCQAFNKCPK